MVVRRRLWAVLIPLVAYALGACLVAFFLHNAKIGSRGLEAKIRLKQQILDVTQELDTARAEHEDWDRRLALLRADQIDRDLLEERGRILLGRVHRNDLVIVAP